MARFRKSFLTAPVLILMLLGLPVLAEVASLAVQQAGFTKHDLAYYLDQNLASFIRPGLKVTIKAATIQDGKFKVRFTIADPKGMPLDRDGVMTPGPVSTSFVAAYIPQGQKLYTSYTTRSVTSPITKNTAVQAAADSGGSYAKIADGEYEYTFKTPVPAGYDPAATHSVLVYSRRDLTEFDLPRYGADAVFTWVPNGAEVKTIRSVVTTATCNKCHDSLGLHGGSRKSVEGCILCHQPQTSDPDTGNSVDMTEMTHKIHLGHNLPSVQAGKPYQIIGNNQSVADYSHVAFPDFPGGAKRCEACHDGSAPQSGVYLTSASRRACGSCHDDVNFATGKGHPIPQVSDNLCSTCHIPQGETEFDASIKGAHTIPEFSADLKKPTLKFIKVENTAPGQKPTVTFTLTDKDGKTVDASTMNSLNLVLSGPTADYGAYKSENARGATRVGNDYVYTFTNAIPEGAKGSFAVMAEGYKQVTLQPDTTKATTVRDVVNGVVTYFSVDGSAVQKRRAVVSEDACNKCHGTVMMHGNFRRNVEACIVCHNPAITDVGRRNKPELMPAESVNFKNMIHKIHTGEELEKEYTVYGFGNNPVNFNEVLYPGDRRNCQACHLPNTYQVPTSETLAAQVSPRDYINPMLPATASCLSCHTSKPAAAHASLMTSATLGEACAACHGPNAEKSVDRAHAR